MSVKGRLIQMGNLELPSGEGGDVDKYPYALVISFENPEDIRQALKDGKCEFEFGD